MPVIPDVVAALRAMKRWLHDYEHGHNNDFHHMIAFSNLVRDYERKIDQEIAMMDWRDEDN